MFSTHHDAQEQRARRKRLAFSIGYVLLGSVALAGWGGTAAAQHGEEAHNARLVGFHNLQARSAYHGVIQEQDGRWIAYIGHHDGVHQSADRRGRGKRQLNCRCHEREESIPPPPPARRGRVADGPGLQRRRAAARQPGKYYLLRTNGDSGHQI